MTNEDIAARVLVLEQKVGDLLAVANVDAEMLDIIKNDIDYQTKLIELSKKELEARAINLEIEKVNQEINLLNQQKILANMKESL